MSFFIPKRPALADSRRGGPSATLRALLRGDAEIVAAGEAASGSQSSCATTATHVPHTGGLMAATQLNELDVVALTVDLPEQKLARGRVGTIVHVHAPGAYEVEFVDHTGHTYALATLRGEQLMQLRYEPAAA